MKKILKITGILVILLAGMATTFKPDNKKYFDIIKNIEIFTNVYKELNTHYVDELDPGKLMRTGIDAMVSSLDPFTNYISESQIESYRLSTEGRYKGIGAASKKIGDYATITELYKDQPADKAGLKVGDQIIAVDGKDTQGKTPAEVNDFMRGFPGTVMSLKIRRLGTAKDFNVNLTREEVNIPNVPYSSMVDEKTGYIALTTFTRDAGRNVAKALKNLKKENPDLSGIILDLRDNGGGLLSEAVNICNIFIPNNELVVTTRGKVKDWDRSFKTQGNPVDSEIPLAILINSKSASASEIVSGVIQDYDRGILLGQRSYGKGLVQNTKDVGYNSKVKLTTAKYYIPSQRCIQSVEYKDGEPVHIPDNKRAKFQTRNGRTVLDGGGVKPDILIDEATNNPTVKALIAQNMIFNFSTEVCLKIDSISSVKNYHFTDFDGFIGYLEAQNFKHLSESEKLLEKFAEKSAEDGLALDGDIQRIKDKIVNSKEVEIENYKEGIIDLIEKEIAGRFHYQKGKIQIKLRNDPEVREAISLLSDTARYNDLLEKK